MIHSLPETFAFALIGLILGELLHRLSLYWAKRDMRGVFSNRHQQHWKCPCLLLLAFLIIVVSGGQNSSGPQQICLRIIPVTIVWALIRVSGAMDNSVEDEIILSNTLYTPPPLRLMFQERITPSWGPDWRLITTRASCRFSSTLSWTVDPRWSTTTPTLSRPR